MYNESQEKWLGYERKRGMLCEFNNYLLRGEEGTFIVNTIKECRDKIPQIKYVITLDADTELVLDSAQKLIGTMEHPVNKPIVENGIVTKGYGLIQPKVGLSLDCEGASCFSKMFAGSGGIDIYSTAESNVYQDLFGEAIFTGKGIYNVEVFDEVLNGEIQENTVLSHDLLEGSYLRTGLATDIELIDGFPSKVNSYMLRLHRWTRGDWQIVRWLKNKKINALSKYKIIDNLRRSLVDIFTLVLFFCGFFWVPLLLIFFPVVFKYKIKKFYAFKNGWMKNAFIRCLTNLIMLPYKAVLYLDAIITTIFRVAFSKKHLHEWVTAADAEKSLGKDLKSYIREMITGALIGFALILTTIIYNPVSIVQASFLFALWWFSPIYSYLISKPLCKN